MERLKRILALGGVVLLLGMYVVVFFLGITASPATKGALMAAIACTIIIPCLIYGMMLIARLLDHRDQKPEDGKKREGKKKS